MKEFQQALCKFWSSFGVPAYMVGQVPDDAELPYITFDVVKADSFSTTLLTAYNWHEKKNGKSNIGACAELLDRISDAIPCRMDCGHGFVKLYRNDVDFQTYYTTPEDKDVIAGRTSYEVRFYRL